MKHALHVDLGGIPEPMSWLNAAAPLNMEFMSVTCDVSQSRWPRWNAAAPQNMEFMSVTSVVSQLGMSSQPAAPQRAELGTSQFESVEQHLAPEGEASRQLFTATLSAVPSANAAASAPGMREQRTAMISAPVIWEERLPLPRLFHRRSRGASDRGGASRRGLHDRTPVCFSCRIPRIDAEGAGALDTQTRRVLALPSKARGYARSVWIRS